VNADSGKYLKICAGGFGVELGAKLGFLLRKVMGKGLEIGAFLG
jgi:hypothetical protein